MSELSLSISQAAETCGVTAKCIRYYEQIGLIPKAARHNGAARTGGNRLYGEDDLTRLRFIRNSRALGLGLADIADLLALSEGQGCPGARPRYRSRLESHLAVVNERIDQLLGLRETLEGLLASADRGGLVGRCGCREAGGRQSPVIRLFSEGEKAARPQGEPRSPRSGRAA